MVLALICGNLGLNLCKTVNYLCKICKFDITKLCAANIAINWFMKSICDDMIINPISDMRFYSTVTILNWSLGSLQLILIVCFSIYEVLFLRNWMYWHTTHDHSYDIMTSLLLLIPFWMTILQILSFLHLLMLFSTMIIISTVEVS